MLGKKRYIDEINLCLRSENKNSTHGVAFEKYDSMLGVGICVSVVTLLGRKLHLQKHLLLSQIPTECRYFFLAGAHVQLVEKGVVVRLRCTETGLHGLVLST